MVCLVLRLRGSTPEGWVIRPWFRPRRRTAQITGSANTGPTSRPIFRAMVCDAAHKRACGLAFRLPRAASLGSAAPGPRETDPQPARASPDATPPGFRRRRAYAGATDILVSALGGQRRWTARPGTTGIPGRTWQPARCYRTPTSSGMTTGNRLDSQVPCAPEGRGNAGERPAAYSMRG